MHADDKDADQFAFLPVTCPNCGREGKVNISRLDHSFTCMQCRRVFHLALKGSVRGERREQIELDPYAAPEPTRSSRLVQKLEELPRAAWWSAGGVAVAALALALAWPMLFGEAVELPESLDDRARFVAEAVARADYRRLKAIVASGGYYAAAEWARNARPADWKPEIPAEESVQVELETIFKTSGGGGDDQAGGALGSAGILVRAKPAAASNASEWMLYWVQDTDLRWLFDAKRTAKGG